MLYAEGKERPKKERDHSRTIGGSFNKARELTDKACLRCLQDESIFMPTRILKVHIDALTGFSHVCHPDAPNNTLLPQDSFFENTAHCRNGGRNVHFKDRGGGEEPPVAWV